MPALKRAAADQDEYYVVTYRAASSGDGKFHPVQLRVKRADAQIRVRSGYWSASPDLLRLAAGVAAASHQPDGDEAAALQCADSPLGRHRARARRPHQRDRTWEPGLAPPRNQRVGSVELKATTDDGKVMFDAPLTSRATFAASPGIVQLEMTIRGPRRQDAGLRLPQHPGAQSARGAADVRQPAGDAHPQRARVHGRQRRHPAASPAPSTGVQPRRAASAPRAGLYRHRCRRQRSPPRC